jgi:hypothetical protein
VAVADEFVHACGGDGDAVLVVLDLARDADLHERVPFRAVGDDVV